MTELLCTPMPAPRTVTVNVKLPPAARIALARRIVLEPRTAVTVPPPVSPVTIGTTTRPDGKLSVNPTPTSPVPFGLVMV